METIKVNMNPNPLDVQTIHASQNDGEARQWGFELHNNGEVIDSSEITDQITFKAYKGGTEQILPENGSVPVTSPFLGDIKYPQGLLADQEFTYRQSPTEEDGLAKITSIKGNTLGWNQLHTRSTESSQTVTKNGVSVTSTRSGNVTAYTASGTVANASGDNNYYIGINPIDIIASHKYLAISSSKYFSLYGYNAGTLPQNQQMFVWTASTSGQMSFTIRPIASTFVDGTVINETFYAMFIDLTQMGLDISNPSDFTSLFSLPYYSYNQGTLLSFNGNGIKTVGKNLIDTSAIEQGSLDVATGNPIASSTRVRTPFIELSEGSYTITSSNGFYVVVYAYDSQQVFNASASTTSWKPTQFTFSLPFNGYVRVAFRKRDNSNITPNQINGERMYNNNTESTLSLPISTYFSNGMKSAGNVYDELTESKAITRIGAVDLGSLTWTMASNNRFISTGIASTIKAPSSNTDKANVVCAKYETQTYSGIVDSGLLGVAVNANSPNKGNICIKDASYNDAAAFKTAMSGVYLYFELATPTETSFTTASLVTENGEIPLSNEDGVLIGKCTEQLSAEPGFHDAKIKLSDSDGECYSNKIQLHIERSPQ